MATDTGDTPRKGLAARAAHFLTFGMWFTRLDRMSLLKRWALKGLQFFSIIGHGFRRDQCTLHAASLTFFSMMALIPILVLALALARTFGGGDLAKRQIDRQLDAFVGRLEQSVPAEAAPAAGTAAPAPEEERQAVVHAFAQQFREGADKLYDQISSINFKTLGGIGLVALLWTVISVLGKIESSFNSIWGVEKARSLMRMFTDYLSVIIILPFLIIAASSVPATSMVFKIMTKAFGATLTHGAQAFMDMPVLKTSLTLLFGTLLFGFILGFMPNTRVKTLSALTGGFVTALLFTLWMKLCIKLQIGIAKYSALYGGFAVLPILLMWVFTSWQIILLGAEIAFAIQNRDTYMMERFSAAASPRSLLLLSLAFCIEAARRARDPAGGPFAAETFAQAKGIPARLVRKTLDSLVRLRILAELKDRSGEYLLCRSGEALSLADIARAYLDSGESPQALGLDTLEPSFAAINRQLDAFLAGDLARPLAGPGPSPKP